MKRRVLFVAYPYLDANMGGVRTRRIARLLPQWDWEVVVLTHLRNETSVDAPEHQGVRVVEVGATDFAVPYRRMRGLVNRSKTKTGKNQPASEHIGFTSEINRWLMVPDKVVPWRNPATRRGEELLRTESFDAIFASLDPRTSLLVATDLSAQFGVPCVLEYRDLWIGNPYYHVTQPTRVHTWLHQRLERKVLARAHRVSAVCQGISDYLSSTYAGQLRKPVELNYNFFDPLEYPEPRPARPVSQPFTISYTGAMYADRAPHQFFEGMRRFIDHRKLTPDQFRFRWAGYLAAINDLGAVIERTGVAPYMDFLGIVPHHDALRVLMDSDAALLIQAPNDQIHIPGKLFEAIGAHIPILALSNPCEVTGILERCNAGIVCTHSPDSVAAALNQFEMNARKQARWCFNEPAVREFSAETAVGKLSRLLESAGD